MHSDLGRSTLAILFIVGLIAACLWIVRPFLPAVIWGATLVIATWPIMLRVQGRLWNSRGLAITIMTGILLVLFVAPFWLAIGTILANSGQIASWMEMVSTATLPPPPSWLGDLPLIGPSAVKAWLRVEEITGKEILVEARPYAGRVTEWFVGAVGGFGMLLFQFLLTVAVAALMYAKGEGGADAMLRFGGRLAGARGRQSVILAGQAIRGVALGVVVTAFIQAAIGAVALLVAGVPYAAILSAIMFMLCIAQLGPALVLIPAVIWMFVSGDTAMAILLLVCSVIAIGSDNILRPLLIKRGVDLPLLLILVGVIGGLIAFGLIGLFLGPTILAVGYTLLSAWVAEGDPIAANDAEARTKG